MKDSTKDAIKAALYLLVMLAGIVVLAANNARAAEPAHACGFLVNNVVRAEYELTSNTGGGNVIDETQANLPANSCDGGASGGLANLPTHFKLAFVTTETVTGATAPMSPTTMRLFMCEDDVADAQALTNLAPCVLVVSNAMPAACTNVTPCNVFLTTTGLTGGTPIWGTVRFVLEGDRSGQPVQPWVADSDSTATQTIGGTNCDTNGCTISSQNSPGVRIGANFNALSIAGCQSPCSYPDQPVVTFTANATPMTHDSGTPAPGGKSYDFVTQCPTGTGHAPTSGVIPEAGAIPQSVTATFNVDTGFDPHTESCQVKVDFANSPQQNNLEGNAWASFSGSSVGSLFNALSSSSFVQVSNFFSVNSALQFSSTVAGPADGKANVASLPASGRVNRGFAITATFSIMGAANATVDCSSSTAKMRDQSNALIQSATVSPSAHVYTTTRTIAPGDPATHDRVGNQWEIEFDPGTSAPCFATGNPAAFTTTFIKVTSRLEGVGAWHAKSSTNHCNVPLTNASVLVIGTDVAESCDRIEDTNDVPINGDTCAFSLLDPSAGPQQQSSQTTTSQGGQVGWCGKFTPINVVAPQGTWTFSYVLTDSLGNSGGNNATAIFTSADTSTFAIVVKVSNATVHSKWINLTIRCNQQDASGFIQSDTFGALCDVPNWQVRAYNNATQTFYNATNASHANHLKRGPGTKNANGYYANWTTCTAPCPIGTNGPFPANRTNHNEYTIWVSANMSGHLIHSWLDVTFNEENHAEAAATYEGRLHANATWCAKGTAATSCVQNGWSNSSAGLCPKSGLGCTTSAGTHGNFTGNFTGNVTFTSLSGTVNTPFDSAIAMLIPILLVLAAAGISFVGAAYANPFPPSIGMIACVVAWVIAVSQRTNMPTIANNPNGAFIVVTLACVAGLIASAAVAWTRIGARNVKDHGKDGYE